MTCKLLTVIFRIYLCMLFLPAALSAENSSTRGLPANFAVEAPETLISAWGKLFHSKICLHFERNGIKGETFGFMVAPQNRIIARSDMIPDNYTLWATLPDGTTKKATITGRNHEFVILSVNLPNYSMTIPVSHRYPGAGELFVTYREGKRVFGRCGEMFIDGWGRELFQTSVPYQYSSLGMPALNARAEVIGFFVSGNTRRKYEHLITIQHLEEFIHTSPPKSEALLELSYRLLRKSSVFIRAGEGSGLTQAKGFIGPEDYIITTGIPATGPVYVYLPFDQTPHEAIRVHRDWGLNILKLAEDIRVQPLVIAKTDSKPEEEFVSIFYLFSSSFMYGAKRAYGTTIEMGKDRFGNDVMKTSILTPGHNDGIAALNTSGEVIGIFSNLSPSRPYEHFIPAKRIRAALRNMEEALK